MTQITRWGTEDSDREELRREYPELDDEDIRQAIHFDAISIASCEHFHQSDIY